MAGQVVEYHLPTVGWPKNKIPLWRVTSPKRAWQCRPKT